MHMARSPGKKEPAVAADKAPARKRDDNMADRIYAQLKQDIAEFRLIPGDRYTETELAERMASSRTPVREALLRLQRDGYVEVQFRNGWLIRPLDFKSLENLYDVRIVLELAAVRQVCDRQGASPELEQLAQIWLVPAAERLQDGSQVANLDERFHETLVEATGNAEMARIHHDVTERIRIVRRLDFTMKNRVEATYVEHAKILRALMRRRSEEAQMLLRSHIEASKAEVSKITLHMIYEARQRAGQG